jgi:hypothetical protein
MTRAYRGPAIMHIRVAGRGLNTGSYEALYGDDAASFATPGQSSLNSCNVFGMRYNRNSGSRAFIPRPSDEHRCDETGDCIY